jgi:hypothetical protein
MASNNNKGVLEYELEYLFSLMSLFYSIVLKSQRKKYSKRTSMGR